MRRAIVTTGAAAILIGAAIGPVGLAAAEESAAVASPDRADSPAQAAKHDRVVLRRDGDRAVPFAIGAPQAPRAEGFHTGDALIGATGAFAVTVLASGSVALARRRRPGRLVERPRAGAAA